MTTSLFIAIALVLTSSSTVAIANSQVLASSNNVEQQGNLTTYENKDYDFSVGYPRNWTAREFNLSSNQVVVFEGPQANDRIEIAVVPAFKGMDIIDVMDALREPLTNSQVVRLMELSNTTMAGYPAVQMNYYQSTDTSQLKALEIIALTNNPRSEQYGIRYITDPAYFDEYLPLVYEMIKSFKIGLE